jgi:signal transduction histidine kinase
MQSDSLWPDLRQLAEALHLAVIVRAAEQPDYVYASPACEELLGRPRARWPSGVDPLAAYVHPADSATMLAALKVGPDQAATPTIVDWRLIGPHGTVSRIRTRLAWLASSSSQHLVSLSEEIPAAPDRSADAEGDDPLEQLSHDLRTPLNAVLGYAQLLARSELNDRQREELAQIERAGQRLLALIEAMGGTS